MDQPKELIPIDEKYTYSFDNGHVEILRNGEPWLDTPPGVKAWISAACQLEELRAKVAELSLETEGRAADDRHLRAETLRTAARSGLFGTGAQSTLLRLADRTSAGREEPTLCECGDHQCDGVDPETEAEQCMLVISASWDDTGHQPLPRYVGPFPDRDAAFRWVRHHAPLSGEFNSAPWPARPEEVRRG
ncbi:hypothetical protein [Pseudoclavibacter sp. JSM 162008]|uniref:hypothetical protein n=1 Tax=Pseudoclavibacter sp. JSM 162008 TaxID=3229855 RepID=UPI00352646D9